MFKSPTLFKGDTMNLQSHIDALKGRHASLDSQIAAEGRRPSPDSATLSRMKLEKLRLKEEMERLKS
jgi:hypothetical protein